MSDDMIQSGRHALQAGRRREARRIFGEAVHQDPDNAEAWWHLSDLVDDPAQKVYCLRQVIELEPDHTEAHRQLADLQHRIGGASSRAVRSKPPTEGVVAPDGTVVVSEAFVGDTEVQEPDRNDWIVMAIAVALALAAMITTVIMVTTGVATEALGIRSPQDEPTLIPLSFGVPACLASEDSTANLVFINNTHLSIDLLRGPQGQEQHLVTLEPDALETIQTTEGVPVRYAVRTGDPAYAPGGAILEVPSASTCRVPIH